MRFLLTIPMLWLLSSAHGQSIYFPPLEGSEWESTDPVSLGWCDDSLDSLATFLAEADTKAFLILKDGRMVWEQYFGDFTQDSIWYWASAGKTLTAFTVGLAQEQGYLRIFDRTNEYLPAGWTSLTSEQENAIRILHQLTMTTGLQDNPLTLNCTEPACLQFEAEPGTRWAYHNAPYTLLREVVEAATGFDYNVYFAQQIRNRIGMNGAWVRNGYNNVYYSNARSMARFGLLVLNEGIWDRDTIMSDDFYFNNMTSSSGTLNPSYGYLWWLNGESAYKLPRLQLSFPGPLVSAAPDDMIAGLGKNDQKLYIVPSQNLVVVRMGEASGEPLLAASNFDDQLWERLSNLECAVTSVSEQFREQPKLLGNPAWDQLRLYLPASWEGAQYQLRTIQGQLVQHGTVQPNIPVVGQQSGLYALEIRTPEGEQWVQRVVLHPR